MAPTICHDSSNKKADRLSTTTIKHPSKKQEHIESSPSRRHLPDVWVLRRRRLPFVPRMKLDSPFSLSTAVSPRDVAAESVVPNPTATTSSESSMDSPIQSSLAVPSPSPSPKQAAAPFFSTDIVAYSVLCVIITIALVLASCMRCKKRSKTKKLFTTGGVLAEAPNDVEKVDLTAQIKLTATDTESSWGTPSEERRHTFSKDISEQSIWNGRMCSLGRAEDQANLSLSDSIALALDAVKGEFEGRFPETEQDVSTGLGVSAPSVSRVSSAEVFPLHSGSKANQSLPPRAQSSSLKSLKNKKRNLSRRGSNASASVSESSLGDTTAEGFERFDQSPSYKSTMTTLPVLDSYLEDLIEEDEQSETETFEVRQAQTQSIAFKRGFLVSWRASIPPATSYSKTSSLNFAPGVVSPSASAPIRSADSQASFVRRETSVFETQTPFLLLTQPSSMSFSSLMPSFSSVSVDLNDFPRPPELVMPGLPVVDEEMAN